MRGRTTRALALAIAGVLVLLTGCAPGPGNHDLPEERVLFIGNSYTFYNGGIDQVLRGLAPNTRVGAATQGGYTLSDHLRDDATMRALRDGDWTRVVLQEQSQVPVWSPAAFLDSATKLATAARAAKAAPMLLMTWARPDSNGVTTRELAASYTSVGTRTKATVIPAGTAFGLSLAEHPSVVLNQRDGHPTRAGTYLAGCVVYATIFGVSPEGNTFTFGLDAATAAMLQAEAWRAHR